MPDPSQRWQSKLQLPTARKEWRPATADSSPHAVINYQSIWQTFIPMTAKLYPWALQNDSEISLYHCSTACQHGSIGARSMEPWSRIPTVRSQTTTLITSLSHNLQVQATRLLHHTFSSVSSSKSCLDLSLEQRRDRYSHQLLMIKPGCVQNNESGFPWLSRTFPCAFPMTIYVHFPCLFSTI